MSKAQELKPDLLPCPMCGCTEILVKKRKTTMVECKACGVVVFNYQDGIERDAIAHWNRRSASSEQQAAQQNAELMEFIESIADFKAQRIRLGSTTGEIRWDVEFGRYGQRVRGDTLANAIKKAMKTAARASNGGKA